MNSTITIFFTNKKEADLFERFVSEEKSRTISFVSDFKRFLDKVGSRTFDVTLNADAANQAFRLGFKWREFLKDNL